MLPIEAVGDGVVLVNGVEDGVGVLFYTGGEDDDLVELGEDFEEFVAVGPNQEVRAAVDLFGVDQGLVEIKNQCIGSLCRREEWSFGLWILLLFSLHKHLLERE